MYTERIRPSGQVVHQWKKLNANIRYENI